jgi:hypothetical protein
MRVMTPKRWIFVTDHMIHLSGSLTNRPNDQWRLGPVSNHHKNLKSLLRIEPETFIISKGHSVLGGVLLQSEFIGYTHLIFEIRRL